MSGNGEPMATEEPPESSPSCTRITFENVRIQTLCEEGGAKDKYPGDNNKIRVEYDPEVSECFPFIMPSFLHPVISPPQGMLVRLLEPGPGEKCLQEFLVKSTVESARLGRRAIVFHLDIETVLLRFRDEEKARKFTSMVSSVR